MHEQEENASAAPAPVWVAATLTAVFLGVALGAAAPGRAAVAPQTRTPALAVHRPPAARPVRASPAKPEAAEPGRGYSPVGVSDELALGPAPAFPVADGAEAPSTGAPASPAALRERAALPPSAALSRPATGLPLLAVRRGSGRIVFHEIEQAGAAGAGMEGEWAVAGRCRERLRMDLAQPARGAGAPRGVGADLSSSGGWRTAVAVPVQGCAAGRILLPRPPSRADRERFAAFSTDELRQVATAADAAWLVFSGRGRSRAMVVLRRGGDWHEAWSRESAGALEISAVLRRADGWDGLFLTVQGDDPDTLQRVRVTGGHAHADAPASLRG